MRPARKFLIEEAKVNPLDKTLTLKFNPEHRPAMRELCLLTGRYGVQYQHEDYLIRNIEEFITEQYEQLTITLVNNGDVNGLLHSEYVQNRILMPEMIANAMACVNDTGCPSTATQPNQPPRGGPTYRFI